MEIINLFGAKQNHENNSPPIPQPCSSLFISPEVNPDQQGSTGMISVCLKIRPHTLNKMMIVTGVYCRVTCDLHACDLVPPQLVHSARLVRAGPSQGPCF